MEYFVEHQPKLRQGLSENCVQACKSAKETVLSLCERFKTGEVSVNEVEIVVKNNMQIIHLFEASTGADDIIISLTSLESAIKERKEEYKQFKKYHTLLLYLCRHISVQVEGKNSTIIKL